MKEAFKKRLLGQSFYPIYRRLRFLRYRKKQLKQTHKQILIEQPAFKPMPDVKKKKKRVSIFRRIYKAYRVYSFFRFRKRTVRQKIKLKAKEARAEAQLQRQEMRKHLHILRQDERKTSLIRNANPVRKKKASTSLKSRIYRLNRILRFLIKHRRAKRIENRAKLKWQRLAVQMEKRELRERLTEKRLIDMELERRQEKMAKLEQKELIRNRKRLIRQLIKSRIKSVFYELKTFDKYTLRRWTSGILAFAENKDKRNSFFMITFNSTVLFIFSYLIIYIIGQVATVITALSFDYKVILFYYKVYYNIDSYQWTSDSVKIIYSVKPAVGLIIAIISLIIYSTRRDTPGNAKLFYLWATVHGSIMFFGSLLMGTMLNKDFGWVISYMYYRDTGKMIYSIVSIFSLIIIGGFLAKSFLISGNSYFNYITRNENKFFLASQVFWPVVIGTSLQILASVPNSNYYMPDDEVVYKVLKLLTILILMIPLLIKFRSFNEVFFDEEPRKVKLNWKYFLFTLLIIAIMRISLQSGIHIG
jgi:hypothetical protein